MEEEVEEEMNLRFGEEELEELNRREEEEDEEGGEDEEEEEEEEEMDRSELCVDLSEAYGEHRSELVKAMRKACRTRGFFWVVNHGIPLRVMEDLISSVRSFHEQPIGPKCFYYVRDLGIQNYYYSSPLLPPPSDDAPLIWRDTLNVPLGPHPPALKQIPGISKKQVLAWDVYVRRMGKVLVELLSEGLGLTRMRLEEFSCLEGRHLAAHSYPPHHGLLRGGSDLVLSEGLGLTRMRLEEFSCLEGRHLAAHSYPPHHGLLRGGSDLVVGPTTDPCVIDVLLHDHDDLTTLELKVGEHWQELHLGMPGCLMVTVGNVLQVVLATW
eukprot:TRINITY_DN12392_c0_g1_i12.p1 TRINITY_DN12392_c0_g1~~TRINITY_DN12392_c0_g1_i12.p1  ORF type:complete len:325 (+),score=59.49 TRINITY_DN12392_c0_g1_i12:60-1034(+)